MVSNQNQLLVKRTHQKAFSPAELQHKLCSKADFVKYFTENLQVSWPLLLTLLPSALRPARDDDLQGLPQADSVRVEGASAPVGGEVGHSGPVR